MTTNNQQDDKMRMAFERAKKGIEMPVYTTEYNPFIKTSIDCETYALGWFIHGYQAALASRAQPDLISQLERWKARCIAAENGHPQVRESNADLISMIRTLTKTLEMAKQTINGREHTGFIDKALSLVAPFLEEK